MGWCSATQIFDAIANEVLGHNKGYSDIQKMQVLHMLADILREHDWDCEADSEFYDHPQFKDIFEEPL